MSDMFAGMHQASTSMHTGWKKFWSEPFKESEICIQLQIT
jgi:hypothetical protein